MVNNLKTFLIGALLLSGCSYFHSNESQYPERSLASVAANDQYLTKGLYPKILASSNVFDSTGKAKIVFNLPPYTNPGGVGILPEILKTIDGAKVSIRMSMFQFNHSDVFFALKKAVQRKVKVLVTTDLCYSGKKGYKEYFDDLKLYMDQNGQSSGTQIVDDATASCDTMFNHNKYMIVDAEDSKNAKAWFGSFNPTNHGSVENVELAIIINDRAPADILKLDFDQQISGKFKVAKKGVYSVLLNKEISIQALSDDEIQAIKAKGGQVTYPQFKIGDASFEFILSPKVKSLSRIVEEVYNSKQEILFSSFAIADQMLISSIINKSDTVNSPYNQFSVLSLPHPYDQDGYSLVKNGDIKNQTPIFTKSNLVKTPSNEVVATLAPIASEIKTTLATPVNYLTPKGELKSTFHYIYPRGELGGKIVKVHVEGIFNSKVIDEQNTLQRLVSFNIPVYKSTLNGELHNKLFLIDEQKTIFGSHNFSQSAENSNDELTIIIDSPKLTKFLKNELYQKTKLFSLNYSKPEVNFTKDAGIAITEVMANSKYKMSWNKKVADIGAFIEIYNYSDKAVNLLGFRYDDHFFPENDNEIMESSTLSGFQGTLVRLTPNKTQGQLGQLDYNPVNNILQPGKSALIVGKYFHEKFYKEQFRINFKEKFKKEPTDADYPQLFSSGEYFSSVLGDSTNGLSPKDKITLYGIDGTTVIDRFGAPRPTAVPGFSLERTFDEERLKSELKSKSYLLSNKKFTLKNGVAVIDTAFLPNTDFSISTDWQESLREDGSPGLVNLPRRSISSASKLYTIEAEVADVNTNTFKKALVVIKDNKFFDIVTSNTSNYPAPTIKDVLIFPGFVDTHNHIKYNTMPVWKAAKFYENRNLWPEESAYKNGVKAIYKSVYVDWPECTQSDENERNKCLAINRCKILKYSEMKALIGGTTSIQGSSSFDENSSDISFKGLTSYTIGAGSKITKSKAKYLEELLDSCSNDLARNIERELWHGHDEIRTTAQSIFADAFARNSMNDPKKFPQTPSGKLLTEFKNKITNTFFLHLGEGRDQPSKAEWAELDFLKLATPYTTIIHGTAFGETEFKAMGANGLSLAWSPTSNLLLYKMTTDIPSALKNNVNVSIGSDWSLSGSKSILYELKVAANVNLKYFKGAISNAELLKMVTINGAKASHLEDFIGSIEKNKLADFFLVNSKLKNKTPLDTLLQINESGIEAVFVGGEPQVGSFENLTALNRSIGSSSEITQIKDNSCYKNLAINMPASTYDSIINVLSDKTLSAYKILNPKFQTSLGAEFSKLDPLCSEFDQRSLSLMQSL